MGTRSLQATNVNLKMSSTVRNAGDANVVASASLTLNHSLEIANGLKLDQANRAWQWKNKTISSGGTQVIDLYDYAGLDAGAGAGNDAVGQALTIEEIIFIAIKNENADGVAGSLEIEPDGTNGWGPIGTHDVAFGGALPAQGVLLKLAPSESGFDVTDASSHRLLLTANGGDVEYSVWVIGRSDDDESSSSSSSSTSSSSSSQSSSSSSSTSVTSTSPSSSISTSSASSQSRSSASGI